MSMRVLISAEGTHDPAGHHHMVVDNFGLLIDLSAIEGALHDPGISRVEWGTVMDGKTEREGGRIVRGDGSVSLFFDPAALAPYLAAFEAKKQELLAVSET